jgi:hypothetical protein
MATIVNFNGRKVIEPGAYSQIKSGVPVPVTLGTYGNVCIIDTGIGVGYGYGGGINAGLPTAGGVKSVYEFKNARDMKESIGGGILYDVADFLWSPSKNGLGPEKVIYVRACTTVPAIKATTFSTGAITLKCKNEGTRGNGALVTNYNGLSIVSRGYGWKLKAGIIDTAKYIIEFYEGQYRGKNADNVEYVTEEVNCDAKIVCQTPEFSSVNDLVAWMATDYKFNQLFALTASTASATSLTPTDLTNFGTTAQLFASGTTSYNPTDVDDVLDNIVDLDNSLFLLCDYGLKPSPAWTAPQMVVGTNNGAQSVANGKILAYIKQNSTFTEKLMFIGGGNNADEFTTGTDDGSLESASYYNDAFVSIVHSGVLMPNYSGGATFKEYDSFYHSAMVCGLTAGMEPQIPITYKNIRISGLVHELKKSEREQALIGGVLHTRYQQQLGWVINQGVNTMQNNNLLISANGQSPEIQIMRIIHQINKELKINATTRFVGGNLFTASAEEIKLFTEGYLQSRSVRALQDNLIIRFENVKVELVNDYWNIEYCFVPNGPINKLFFTGYILDPNIKL